MQKLSELFPDASFIPLDRGSHKDRTEGVCLMEAVAWWAGETHTDHPDCVQPWLATLGMNLNDSMLDHYRLGFAELVPELAGTANDGKGQARIAAHIKFVHEELIPFVENALLTDGKPDAMLNGPFLRALASTDDFNKPRIDNMRIKYHNLDADAWLETQEMIFKHFKALVRIESPQLGGPAPVPSEPVEEPVAAPQADGGTIYSDEVVTEKELVTV